MLGYNELVNDIIKAREAKSINQSELAVIINVSKQYVCMIESGAKAPSIEFLRRCCVFFKLNPAKFKAVLLKIEEDRINKEFST